MDRCGVSAIIAESDAHERKTLVPPSESASFAPGFQYRAVLCFGKAVGEHSATSQLGPRAETPHDRALSCGSVALEAYLAVQQEVKRDSNVRTTRSERSRAS